MERYKCKLCFKSFINGKALGGHMRSHLEDEEEERPSQLSEYDNTESDSSSSSSDNQKRRNRVDDDEDDEDEESETESFPTRRRRSKRTRKLGSFDVKQSRKPGESVTESAASDTTTEEDLAFCLIMLSRDKWKKQKTTRFTEDDYETEYEESYKARKRFKCETCGKVFKSYQALGGHRASHKKNKIIITTKTEEERKTEYVNGVKKRIHECPICFRVFSSGQALGGHKRSHGSSFNQNQIEKDDDEVLLSVKQRMIDLNLPATNEEEDDDDEFGVLIKR